MISRISLYSVLKPRSPEMTEIVKPFGRLVRSRLIVLYRGTKRYMCCWGAVELKHLFNQLINIKWLRQILKEMCHIFDSSHALSQSYLPFFFVICGSEHIFSG